MELSRVIERLRPGSNPLYAHSNATLLSEIIEWRDDFGRPIPTQVEVDAEWLLVLAEDAAAAQLETQTALADSSLRSLFTGLESLSADDAAYAAMGRAVARKDGASQVVINSIVNRATAVTYLTSKTEWTGLPASAKLWLADHLDMEATLFQVLLVVLRSK